MLWERGQEKLGLKTVCVGERGGFLATKPGVSCRAGAKRESKSKRMSESE